MGAKSQNKYILSRRKRGEVIEEAIDYFVVKSVYFTKQYCNYFPFEKFGCVVGNLFNIQMIYKHLRYI